MGSEEASKEMTLKLCFKGKEKGRPSPVEEAAVPKGSKPDTACPAGSASASRARAEAGRPGPRHTVLLSGGPGPTAAPRNLSEI